MKVAILVRGISYHPNYYHHSSWHIKIDYRCSFDSYIEHVIKPLKGHHVDVFLVSYNSDLEQTIKNDFKPTQYQFVPIDAYDQIKLLNSGIDMLIHNNVHQEYDFIIITRFDLIYHQPITNVLDFKKFNLCFREASYENAVSDILYCFPSSMLKSFNSIISTCKWLHGILKLLENAFGNIHFMTEGYYNSNATVKFNPNPLFYIHRSFISQNYTVESASYFIKQLFRKYLERTPTVDELDLYTYKLVNDELTSDLLRSEFFQTIEFKQKHAKILGELDDTYKELLDSTIHDIERSYDICRLLSGDTTYDEIKVRLYKHPLYHAKYNQEIKAILHRFPSYYDTPHNLYNLAKALKSGLISYDFLN